MNELTYTRILMLEIRDMISEPVIINDLTVKNLYFHLVLRRYDDIQIEYGKEFFNAMLKLHEKYELYEECAEMLRQSKAISDI